MHRIVKERGALCENLTRCCLFVLLVATFETSPIIQEKAHYVKFLTSCGGGKKAFVINIVSFVP
jgi:hypothetical protein